MMSWLRLGACSPVVVAALSAQALRQASAQTPDPRPILLEGGRLIVDARRAPIENAALLIDRGRVVASGAKGSLKAPPGAVRVDFSGKTILPAIVDAHVHLGYQVGLTFAAENFTRETLLDQLNRYAYAGVAAVLSLGTEPGDLPFQIRAEQDAARLGGEIGRAHV